MSSKEAVEKAERLKQLPPYLFAELDKQKKKALQEGMDLIDLGVGDPDRGTPSGIIARLCEEAYRPENHRYPSYEGLASLRAGFAAYCAERLGVSLNPEGEVLTLIGSKEGIAHLPLAFVNPGDFVLMPDPGYPVYYSSCIFAGGIPYFMPLLKENNFLPDLDAIDPQVAQRAKVMFLNYPNNPTAASVDEDFFARAVAFAQEHKILLCHDAAYCEMVYDSERPKSLLQTPGAKEVSIEFHSLSKSFNMTGWRVGFAAGRKEAIAALREVKCNIDSGLFQAVQWAGLEALQAHLGHIPQQVKVYQERRDILVDGLNRAGWKIPKPKATFYVWIPVPPGYTSTELSSLLLLKAGIVTTPGVGFGKNGEGFIRAALTVEAQRIREAVQRIKEIKM